ncbi:MAG: Ig-like domain-containing protein [Candidatus Micrarchaeota archaeon]
MARNVAFYIICLLVLILAAPMAGAVTTVSLEIQKIIGNYTNDNTPQLTITADTTGTAPTMRFLCSGTTYSDPIPFISPVTDFQINSGNFGCSTADGLRDINVLITDDDGSSASALSSVTLDTTSPTVTNQAPANGSSSVNKRPTIAFDFADTGIGIANPSAQVVLHINGDFNSFTTITAGHAELVPTTDFPDGVYNIRADVNDDLNNNNPAMWTFTVDTTAVVYSISINNGVTDTNRLDVNISVSGETSLNQCRFKNVGGDYGAWIAFAPQMPFTLTGADDNNKTVIGQCTDSLGNQSAEFSDSIRLDTSPPNITQFDAVPTSSSSIHLTWTVPDALSGSGLSQFILTQTEPSGTSPRTISGTSFDYNITGLAADTLYSFSLVAKDNAGNYSTPPKTTSTRTFAGTSGNNNNNNNNNNGNGGTGDTISPIASWVAPLSGQVVKGTVKLRVNATDNVSVASVKFYIDNDNVIYKMVVSHTANVFETDWNSTAVSNGLHTLIARATDTSGNPKDVQIPVTVNNSAVDANDLDQNSGSENDSLDNSVPFAARFSQANSDWFSLLLLSNFKSDSDATAKLLDARQKLLEAQAAFDSQDEASANQKLEDAIEIIGPLKDSLGFGSLTAFDSRQLNSVLPYSFLQLQQFGLNSELATLSLQDSTLVQATRELFVFEHTNENGEKEYFVKLVVKIKNTSGVPQDLEFIEIIPKSLLQSASGLVSDYSFSVLQDDPLVQWSLSQVPSEKEIRISYAPVRAFTLDEVRQMLDGKTLSEFQNRPLLVTKKNTENKNVLASTPWLAGFSLLSNAPLVLIGFVILLWFFVLSLGYWNLKRNDPVFSFETASVEENKPIWFSRLNRKIISPQPAAKPQAGIPLLWNNNAPVQKNALAKLIEGDKRPNLQPRPIQGEPVNWWKENKRPPAN